MALLTYQRLPYLKAYIHVLAIMPLIYLWLAVAADELGGDPVQAIIHFLGKGAANLLILTLLITPVARRFKEGLLIATRRLIGLYCFFYAVLHVTAFLWLDLGWEFYTFVTEIYKRPYILVGMLGFIILLLLALTSPNFVRRKMGSSWKKLHKLIYLSAVLVPVHYYWSVKSGWVEPAIYLAIFICLLIVRKNTVFTISS